MVQRVLQLDTMKLCRATVLRCLVWIIVGVALKQKFFQTTATHLVYTPKIYVWLIAALKLLFKCVDVVRSFTKQVINNFLFLKFETLNR